MQSGMSSSIAQDLLDMLQMIECPYTKDISHSYLADLLLVDSPRRSRILIWLFARIDPEIEKIIEANHKNPEISGHADLDGPVRLLTGLASSLGLCRPGDVELIRGKCSSHKQIAFWKNFIKGVCEILEHGRGLALRHSEFSGSMEKILRTCDIGSFFSSASTVALPAVVSKEVQISQRRIFPSRAHETTSDEYLEKLSAMRQELESRKQALENVQKDFPYSHSKPDDASTSHKLVRSMTLNMNDLEQLETTFMQTHDSRFRVHCNRTLPDFGRLGFNFHIVDRQLKSYVELMQNLKAIKENRRRFSDIAARLTKEDPLFEEQQSCLAMIAKAK